MKRSRSKVNNILSVSVVALVLIIVNFANQSFFARFDLTEDKRYSLRDASIEILEELEDPVFIKVYLEGEFPADFKRLRDALKQTLDELRAYESGKIEYEFIDPSSGNDPVARKRMYEKLTEAGLEYTNLTFRTKGGGVEEKILFPGALITYRNKQVPFQILRSTNAKPGANLIQNSIQNLEYNLMAAITEAATPKKKRIAWIGGHGEIAGYDAYDIVEHLADRYVIYDVDINEKLDALRGYDLIVMAGPQTAVSERDKFIIDQFIMRGGSAIFLVDGFATSLDSLRDQQQTIGLAASHNMYDMLFNYGVRLNKDILLDASCAPIPINVGKFGDQANIKLFPWFFHPVLNPTKNHPIVSNVSPVMGQFMSSLDTVGGSGSVEKEVILTTSESTLRRMAPSRVDFDIVAKDPGFDQLSVGPKAVAVLLQGKFQSLYANRISPQIDTASAIAFQDNSLRPSRIMVIADGAVAKNYHDPKKERIFPLGYDKFLQKNVYGNKEFLTNAVDYLLNDDKLIRIRSKNIVLRKLNDRKVLNKEVEIQWSNVGLPILFVGLLVGLVVFVKRKKFS